jgi:hypothetical protein
MGVSLKGFATIRIMVANVAESHDWYRSSFGKEPEEEIRRNIAQIQVPFGNVIGLEAEF